MLSLVKTLPDLLLCKPRNFSRVYKWTSISKDNPVILKLIKLLPESVLAFVFWPKIVFGYTVKKFMSMPVNCGTLDITASSLAGEKLIP